MKKVRFAVVWVVEELDALLLHPLHHIPGLGWWLVTHVCYSISRWSWWGEAYIHREDQT